MPERSPIHIQHFLQPPTTELSHFLCGDNQLVICNGCNPSYKKGVLMKDVGYSNASSNTLQSGKSITGLFNFRQSASVQKMLATVNNSGDTATQLFYLAAPSTNGAWTEITAAETAWSTYEDCLVEMEGFIGYCFFVGYDSTDNVFLPVASLTGTTFSTSTNVGSMPQAKYIKRYRDRLYIANCYNAAAQPYRVYFSSVPSAGAITWTPASDFIDVDYSEEITGIAENWDRLVIFTEYSAYFYNQSEKKKMWDIGCSQNRSIQNAGDMIIWGNQDNIWASKGGFPTPIGSDIQELVRQSTTSNWRSAVMDNEYYIYLGNTQANGLTYNKCLATYNIETGMWRWRELYGAMTEMALYKTSARTQLLMGSSDGWIYWKGKYSDSSSIVYGDYDSSAGTSNAIVSHFRTKAYDLGDPSIIKNISKVIAYAEQGMGLTLYYRLFNAKHEQLQEFQRIGTLNQLITIFNEGIAGYFIQFEGREMSTNPSWKFYGLTMLGMPDSRL